MASVASPRVVNISDLRRLAERRLPRAVFDYIDGGADGEVTLRENCRAFEAVTFRPRGAVAVPQCELGTTVLGTHVSMPILLAPLGSSRMFYPRGEEVELLLHPVAFAGWVGLFVTALNLLPISQLDGGHIGYALFGRRSRFIAGLAFVGLALVTLSHGYHYTVMLVLLWFMGIKHPPTLNDSLPLGRDRRIVGIALGVIFVLSFTPSPFQL